MKIKYALIPAIAVVMWSCGGTSNGDDHSADNAQTTEVEATAEDLEIVEETETVKMKAEAASAKADSILNAL